MSPSKCIVFQRGGRRTHVWGRGVEVGWNYGWMGGEIRSNPIDLGCMGAARRLAQWPGMLNMYQGREICTESRVESLKWCGFGLCMWNKQFYIHDSVAMFKKNTASSQMRLWNVCGFDLLPPAYAVKCSPHLDHRGFRFHTVIVSALQRDRCHISSRLGAPARQRAAACCN